MNNRIFYNQYYSLDAPIRGFDNKNIRGIDNIQYDEIDYRNIEKQKIMNHEIKEILYDNLSIEESNIAQELFGLNGCFNTYAETREKLKVSNYRIIKSKKKLFNSMNKFEYDKFRSSSLFQNDRISATNIIRRPVEDFVVWKISIEDDYLEGRENDD